MQSRRKDVGSGYSSLAANLVKFSELGQHPATLQLVKFSELGQHPATLQLVKFSELGQHPATLQLVKFSELGQHPATLQLERLDEGRGIETAMVENRAQYHQSCRLRHNSTKLQRAQKRLLKIDGDSDDTPAASKRTRSQSRTLSTEKMVQDTCFFCQQPGGTDGLHDVTTFETDKRVRSCANLLGDTELLGRLSADDMVALEAKYHIKCLVGLDNNARKARLEGIQDTYKEQATSASQIAFTELVLYIDEMRLDEETAPVFKLAELTKLYHSRMEQLGIKLDTRVHSTRLKERLLVEFPDMQAYNKAGFPVFLYFLFFPIFWTILLIFLVFS